MGEKSAIESFYDGKSVFITGVSGFLGKLLLEKLLRSCSGVKKVYVLIRDKRNVSSQDRIAQLLDSKAFKRLTDQDTDATKKVIPVCGDLGAPGLGLSKEDQDELKREVSVVFHAAATVKFEEPLKTAANINLGGTASVLSLCKEMPRLKALVYVSTAFCNCERPIIEERVYPAPTNPDEILQAVSQLDVAEMDVLYEKTKGEKRNTYIFTKALSESYLEKHGKGLPIAIFRPSIIGNSWQEPYPGWVDAVHGAGGAILAVAAGAWRNSYSHADAIAFGIPVDMCVNLMLAIAWDTGRNAERNTDPEPMKVYNFCSGLLNPVKWTTCIASDLQAARTKYCLENAIWYPCHRQETSYWKFKLKTTLYEAVPAHLTDMVARFAGQKPIAVKIYNRIQQTTFGLQYFMNEKWEFRSKNVPELFEAMTPEDKEQFYFDVTSIDWEDYAANCVLGYRTYFLKQDPSTIPASIKRMRRLYYAKMAVEVFQIALLLFLLYGLFWAMTSRTQPLPEDKKLK